VFSTFSKPQNLGFQVFEHFQNQTTFGCRFVSQNLQTNQWVFAKTPGNEAAVKGG
jgi:hypothetical protein